MPPDGSFYIWEYKGKPTAFAFVLESFNGIAGGPIGYDRNYDAFDRRMFASDLLSEWLLDGMEYPLPSGWRPASPVESQNLIPVLTENYSF